MLAAYAPEGATKALIDRSTLQAPAAEMLPSRKRECFALKPRGPTKLLSSTNKSTVPVVSSTLAKVWAPCGTMIAVARGNMLLITILI